MPEFQARFEKKLVSSDFTHLENIQGYFEKKIQGFRPEKIISIEYETIGYTMSAVVSYKDKKEMYPGFWEVPIGWKAIFDKREWGVGVRKRAKAEEEE